MRIIHIVERGVDRDRIETFISKVNDPKLDINSIRYTTFKILQLLKASIVHIHGLPTSIVYLFIFIFKKPIILTLYAENLVTIKKTTGSKRFQNYLLYLRIKILKRIARSIVINDASLTGYEFDELSAGLCFINQGYSSASEIAVDDIQMGINHIVYTQEDTNKLSATHIVVETMRYLPKSYNCIIDSKETDVIYKEEIIELSKNLGVDRQIFFHNQLDPLTICEIVLVNGSSIIDYKNIYCHLCKNRPVLIYNYHHKLRYEISGIYYLSSKAPKTIAQNIKMISESFNGADVKELIDQFSFESGILKYSELYKGINTKG